jgi:fatty acyl-CoA reductase
VVDKLRWNRVDIRAVPIAGTLAKRRIALTGVTGFLGTAVAERLLRCIPDCEVWALIRPTRRSSASERLRKEVLKNDCFDQLRSLLGEAFEPEMEARFHALSGDVTSEGLGLDDASLEILGSCDAVIHCAASVSFESPWDSAVEVNLLGPSRVAGAIETAAAANRTPPAYMVSVSTAYVAGLRPGMAPELPLTETPMSPKADWRGEVLAARRKREDAESQSREPEMLSQFSKKAREEYGSAGTFAIAERTEKLRTEWVERQLIQAGKARAASLGWADAYTYTKALGERALMEQYPHLPMTIVRPSIIESAMIEPSPGWIRGFRMAEPVIVSYARGLLTEFPGIPEGVVDVIPVDMVVAAILAATAEGLEAQERNGGVRVYQVASGSRNPLTYGHLVSLVQSWFTEHPLFDERGQPIAVPEWSFPGRGKVEGQLKRATQTLGLAQRAVSLLPARGRLSDIAVSLDQQRARAERALGYVELYGAYVETEARFATDNLMKLWDRIGEDEKQTFCFDPEVIDWDDYVTRLHLPSVVRHGRVSTTPPRKGTMPIEESRRRLEKGRTQALDPARQLAVFDLEHTLVASNVVSSYVWLAAHGATQPEKIKLAARVLKDLPKLIAMERRDRGEFLRTFYREAYEGKSKADIEKKVQDLFDLYLAPRIFPEGIRRVRAHRAAGHATLLVTGALDLLVAPLLPLFDGVISARMETKDGILTGRLLEVPPTAEVRANSVRQWAIQRGIDLSETVAYADSASDLGLLDLVGFPMVVNPDQRLALIAKRRGWPVEQWDRATQRTAQGKARLNAALNAQPRAQGKAGS